MKSARLLSLILIVGSLLPVSAQNCAKLGGNWTVHEEVVLKYCSLGDCATTISSGDSTIAVTQTNCGITFNSDAVNPATGEILPLSRSGSISCSGLTYTGPVGLSVTGVVYTTNWIHCSGVLEDGQIVVNCIGRAAGKAKGNAFTLDVISTGTWQGSPTPQVPVISKEPTNLLAGLGSNITVTVSASGPCLEYQWLRNGATIPGATSSNLVLRRIQRSDAGIYSVSIHNFSGSVLSREAKVEVADLSAPKVAFITPTPGRRVTTNMVKVTGTATDNAAVVRVNLSVNGGAVTQVLGTNKWSAFATLVPGTNVLLAQAWDQAGFPSAPVARTVFYAVPTPLVVTTDGRGSVRPNLNGRSLEIGRAYTMTAVPASGWISAGWSDGGDATSARLRFLHEENLELTAYFVPNPYPPLAGNYRGLFSESPAVRPESCGSISLTLTSSGAFSGNLRNAGRTSSFTGRFDVSGHAEFAVGSGATNQWLLDLSIALDDRLHQITGSTYRGNRYASLLAERAVFDTRSNPAPFAPRCTFLVQGATDAALTNAGDGFGTITTTRAGLAKLTGTLADNAALALSSPVLRAGWWPFYQPLYGGRGCLIGWLQFRTDAPAGFAGSAQWIRPANSNVVWYARGFTNISTFIASAYVAPVARTDRVLAFQSGRAAFNGGSLSVPFANRFNLSARGVATNLSANKLSLTIQPATGIFTGNVMVPGLNSTLPIKGAVLQGQNIGGGILQSPSANGRVTIEAAP